MLTKTEDKAAAKLIIKNMVCNRCIKVVKEELENLGFSVLNISLGEAEINREPDENDRKDIKEVLEENGFELIEDKRAKTIEDIKRTVLELVRNDEERNPINLNYSEILVKSLGMEYHYISNLFSSVENITIEQYIILQKIERAKEFLKYGELTLSEIAYKLGYSSVQHLSNQFKKITGMTASQFKSMTENLRKPLDKVTS